MAKRQQIIQHLRTNETNVKPDISEIEYGEIAINYKKDEEKIFIKNDGDELVTFVSKKEVDKKQDIISDLETIRSGAAKGATALQSVPSEYVTETELANKGYLTDVSNKQDTITDLNTIRTNSQTAYNWGNHATAGYLKTVPSEYVTETELTNKGYLTSASIPTKTS